MKTVVAILFSLLLSSAHAACSLSEDDLEAYQECVEGNSCLCSECDPDPTDSTPTLTYKQPKSCQDVNRIFCPLINCCSKCAEEARKVHRCASDTISEVFAGSETCPLICSAYDFTDNAECDEYEDPNGDNNEDTNGDESVNDGSEESCEIQMSSYTDCVSAQDDCDACDLSDLTQTDLPNCCDTCSEELNALVECNASNGQDERGQFSQSVQGSSSRRNGVSSSVHQVVVLAMGIAALVL